MLRNFSDRILVGAALLALAGSGVWFGVFADPAVASRLTAAPSPSRQLAEASALAAVPEPGAEAFWRAPVAQRRGNDWTYDVFTPPQIRYEPRSGRLTVMPDETAPTAHEATRVLGDPDFRMTLKRIEPEPFRLQLLGVVGMREAPRGVFENVLSGEVLLLGAQSSVGALALTVEQVFVERSRAADAGDSPPPVPVAKAIVRDERTGARMTLTTAARLFTAELVAVVGIPSSDGETQAVREGDQIRDGAVVYRIDKIQLAPAAVSVSKWGAGQLAPESRTLVLQPEATAGQSSGSL